jgi:threonylcarbamoyladenosine tRNA methylthiotransferase MtaB
MAKRVAFYTLGCKVNQYETEKLREGFEALGFVAVPETAAADVYVINSCTVTGIADRKSRNFARRAKRLNPNALVVMAGCYAETSAAELAGMPEIDMLAGTFDKESLPERVCGMLGGSASPAESSIEALDNGRVEGAIGEPAGRTRAYLKIEDGCDRYCAYCVIPYARGAVRSRPMRELIDEAAALIRDGYKEIILTGINAALYNDDGRDLIRLTENISALSGDFRIRLSSLEPTTVNAEYARRLIRIERLCPHLHLSLQSGSDAVLAAMGRNYAMKDYMDIVRALKGRDPLFGLTTDIIVGFPGETESDFQRSVEAVREAGFSHVHVFRYSKRPGTRAAEMPDQIPEHIKRRRAERLIAEAAEAAAAYRAKCHGATRRALVLGSTRALADIGVETGITGSAAPINTFTYVTL